jgi:hypothetical protein
MVSGLGALVRTDGARGVGLAGKDDGEALGSESRAELGSEGEGDVFFCDLVAEVGAGVGAAVAGVDDNQGALRWRVWRGRRRGLCSSLRSGLGLATQIDRAQGDEQPCAGEQANSEPEGSVHLG